MNIKKIILSTILLFSSKLFCEFYVHADATIVEDQVLTFANFLAERFSKNFGEQINPEDLFIKVDTYFFKEEYQLILPFKLFKNNDGTFKKENDVIKFSLMDDKNKLNFNLTLKKSEDQTETIEQLLKLLEEDAHSIKSKL